MTNWYYELKGKSIGPVSEAMMREWFKAGSVTPAHLVRKDDTGEWQRADGCEELLIADGVSPELSNDVIHSVLMVKIVLLFQLLIHNPVAQIGLGLFLGFVSGYPLSYYCQPGALRQAWTLESYIRHIQEILNNPERRGTALGVWIGTITVFLLLAIIVNIVLRRSLAHKTTSPHEQTTP